MLFNITRMYEEAEYIIRNNCTVRECAKAIGVSKSTVHKDVTHRLKRINRQLFIKVDAVLQKNKSERCIRGGMATKLKYLNMKKA